MALGGGLRFAVPEIHNINSSRYSDVAGAKAFGNKGEEYVAFFNEDASSFAAGVPAWRTNATNATNSAFNGYAAAVGGSATAGTHFLGVWASSVQSSQMGWIQVKGTVTAQITGAASASADVNFHGFVGTATDDWGTVAITAISGNHGVIWAPQSANSTLATINLAGRFL